MPTNPDTIPRREFSVRPPQGYWFVNFGEYLQDGDLRFSAHIDARGQQQYWTPIRPVMIGHPCVNNHGHCRPMGDGAMPPSEPVAATPPDHAAIKRHLERLS